MCVAGPLLMAWLDLTWVGIHVKKALRGPKFEEEQRRKKEAARQRNAESGGLLGLLSALLSGSGGRRSAAERANAEAFVR